MNILLITATLKPPAQMPNLVRSDPAVRLNDYQQALGFYVSLLGTVLDKIVFVDNSGAELDELKAVAHGVDRDVEFLSFEGMNHPPAFGRGYAEFKLLDYAMEHARTVCTAPHGARFWKVTGRYRVRNLPAIVRRAPPSFTVYVDLRRYPVPWFDTRIMAWTHEGYRTVFRGIYEELREDLLGAPAEERLYPMLLAHVGRPGIVPRFTIQPRVEGTRGFDNRNYHTGINLLKYYIRRVTRRLVPSLWI
jgi:hypothetical protein